MGRKIDLKKIENSSRCHVTFSKRRNSLIKKSYEICVFCGVDVIFLTFSPSGRVSQFCSRPKMEDVLHRYIKLPSEKKYQYVGNSQAKLQKLQQLNHIKGDHNKLHYLTNLTRNLELHIKKAKVELEIAEANIKEYEPEREKKPSMTQLMWCEKNLKNALKRITNRKQDLLLAKLSSSNWHFSFMKNQENKQVEVLQLFSNNSSTTGNNIADQLMMDLNDHQNLFSTDLLTNIQHDNSFITNSNSLRTMISENVCDEHRGIGNPNPPIPPLAFPSPEQQYLLLSPSSPALHSQLQQTNGFYNIPSDDHQSFDSMVIDDMEYLPPVQQSFGSIGNSSMGPLEFLVDEIPSTIDLQFQGEMSNYNREMNNINVGNDIVPIMNFAPNSNEIDFSAAPSTYESIEAIILVNNENCDNLHGEINNQFGIPSSINELNLPPLISSTDFSISSTLPDQCEKGNEEVGDLGGNQVEEGCAGEWDDIMLAENLYLKDFDILFE